MTTANLMNVSSVGGKFAAQVNNSKNMQDENLEVAEAFAGFMNQAGQALNQMVDDVSSTMDMSVENTKSAVNSYERYSYKENQIEDVKAPSIDEKLEESADTLEQGETDVITAISEECGVSEEEIQALLENMGLSALDLLNPENLVNFIMQLTGVTTSEELLLVPEFLQIMETISNIADGLMKELNVDMDGLQELVNQMEVVSEETKIPVSFEEALEVAGENQNTEETAQTQQAETTEQVEVSVDYVDDVPVKADNMDAKQADTEQNTQMTDTKTIVVSKDMEQEAFASSQSSEGNALLNHNSNTETIVLNQTTANVNTVTDMSQTQFASYMSTDTVQIMEQIVQQMRVTISTETTSMEMQLNPENLGKVYVNISSEEGVVNAQFHATNEIVKEALETQIATLRENLNQAGVKVDAIEVTIASHEFERNLEQNQQSQEEQLEKQAEQSTRRRNISVDSLDELSGVMTEEETLVAQMMKENGNSVDFTA